VACLLLLLTPSCTENDEQLVEDVGVTRLFLVDPGLRRQSVITPDDDIQVAEWDIASAVLDIDGALVDLLIDNDCQITDTVLVSPVSEGPCSAGIVIESSDQPFSIKLTLSINSMQVRRGAPLEPPLATGPNADWDSDFVPDDGNDSGSAFDAPCGLGGVTFDCDDNCPLVSNPDQADDNADGVGNACTAIDFFLGVIRDSDGDGVGDSSDNCVWIANPDQEDTTGPADGDIPDGIGDACEEQLASVNLGGASSFQLTLRNNAMLLQPFESTTFLTVDFDNADVLSCLWEAGSCDLDAGTVQLCGQTSFAGALGGC
jgi:hypothetical protein